MCAPNPMNSRQIRDRIHISLVSSRGRNWLEKDPSRKTKTCMTVSSSQKKIAMPTPKATKYHRWKPLFIRWLRYLQVRHTANGIGQREKATHGARSPADGATFHAKRCGWLCFSSPPKPRDRPGLFFGPWPAYSGRTDHGQDSGHPRRRTCRGLCRRPLVPTRHR